MADSLEQVLFLQVKLSSQQLPDKSVLRLRGWLPRRQSTTLLVVRHVKEWALFSLSALAMHEVLAYLLSSFLPFELHLLSLFCRFFPPLFFLFSLSRNIGSGWVVLPPIFSPPLYFFRCFQSNGKVQFFCQLLLFFSSPLFVLPLRLVHLLSLHTPLLRAAVRKKGQSTICIALFEPLNQALPLFHLVISEGVRQKPHFLIFLFVAASPLLRSI
mmetsp:Transcript_8138/g.21542  ORF Transcript_8138/g.21542 Transcript_8138/m.21542 type:complete len:214 (+) Transcript_8138:2064-2705(+)